MILARSVGVNHMLEDSVSVGTWEIGYFCRKKLVKIFDITRDMLQRNCEMRVRKPALLKLDDLNSVAIWTKDCFVLL
jgi:hypothetical protein